MIRAWRFFVTARPGLALTMLRLRSMAARHPVGDLTFCFKVFRTLFCHILDNNIMRIERTMVMGERNLQSVT